MKLETEVTRQDYLDFNIYHFIRTRLIRTIAIGLVGLLTTLFLINRDKTSVSISNIIVFALIYLIIYSIIIYSSLLKTRSVPKDNGSFLGKTEYQFLDDCIYFKDKASEGKLQWIAIKSIKESDKAFYLYIDTNLAIIIPKRHFNDKIHQQHFQDYVRSKLKVA